MRLISLAFAIKLLLTLCSLWLASCTVENIEIKEIKVIASFLDRPHALHLCLRCYGKVEHRCQGPERRSVSERVIELL